MPVPVDPDFDSLPSGAILYSYRWQCDQCLLVVVGPGLRFTVMGFLSFGVKETGGGGMLLVLQVNIYRSIERTNERTNEQWAMGEISNLLISC